VFDVVLQRDGDLAGVLDDVGVGDDVAVLRVDDDARSCAAELALTLLGVRRQAEEAAEPRVLEEGISRSRDRAADGDVDQRATRA